MKKISLSLCFIMIFVFQIYSQNPIKQRITQIVEKSNIYPIDAKDAATKVGENCDPEENVMKPHQTEIDKLEALLKENTPGSVDLNAYLNSGGSTSPGLTEMEFLNLYGEFFGENQNFAAEMSLKIGNIKTKFENEWIKAEENFMAEIGKCPSKSEGETYDPACLNPIKNKYEGIYNKLISSYIAEMKTALTDYKTQILNDNKKIEDKMEDLKYGEESSMPTTKTFIFTIQSSLLAMVVVHGESVSDLWKTCCEKQAEILTMKNMQ